MVDEYGLDGLYGVASVNRLRFVERQIAVHLVGRDVVQPHPVPAHRLQHGEGADDVGVQERLGIGQRIVDVGLGGEVHDGVGLGDELRHQLGVGDVALHQPDVVGDRRQRFAAARIRQRVEHRHRPRCSRTALCTKLAPMNPAPPVTSNRMDLP